MSQTWSWKKSGIMMALVLLAAIVLVKPIGVSTQYVITDGIFWNMFSDDLIVQDAEQKTGYASTNAYLNKSGGKYAKSVANPINYSYIFVFAMVLGGLIGYFTTGAHKQEKTKEDEAANSKQSYIKAFFAGALVLFGARLAGGCTSGHMLSGIMQTSVSGFMFMGGALVAAIPVAMFLYRRNNTSGV